MGLIGSFLQAALQVLGNPAWGGIGSIATVISIILPLAISHREKAKKLGNRSKREKIAETYLNLSSKSFQL